MKTTVVVLNYNGEKYLGPLLERLKGEPCKSLIVDNNSTDNSRKIYESRRTGPHIRWLDLEENFGFALGNNFGAMHVSTPNILFLNNDTLPSRGFVRRMEAQLSDEVGIVGAKLVYGETKEMDVEYEDGSFTWKTEKGKLQHAGIGFHPGGAPYEMGRDLDPDDEIHNTGKFVDAVTAACMLISRADFMQLKGFDPAYLNGFEDVDLCLRAKEEGIGIWYEPVEIIHYCSSTKGRFKHENQNREIYMDRWVESGRFNKLED